MLASLSHVITIFLNWVEAVDGRRKYIHALGLFPLSLENLQGYSSIKEFSVPKNDAYTLTYILGEREEGVLVKEKRPCFGLFEGHEERV